MTDELIDSHDHRTVFLSVGVVTAVGTTASIGLSFVHPWTAFIALAAVIGWTQLHSP